MESYEKEQMLYMEICSSIESVIRENEMTYAQIIGVLEVIKDDFIVEFKMDERDALLDEEEDE